LPRCRNTKNEGLTPNLLENLLECGMRFLTDYLKGDVYYKARREKHNLDRCRVQFKLLKKMAEKFDQTVIIIERYR